MYSDSRTSRPAILFSDPDPSVLQYFIKIEEINKTLMQPKLKKYLNSDKKANAMFKAIKKNKIIKIKVLLFFPENCCTRIT
jgi:hypothetical protein